MSPCNLSITRPDLPVLAWPTAEDHGDGEASGAGDAFPGSNMPVKLSVRPSLPEFFPRTCATTRYFHRYTPLTIRRSVLPQVSIC